MLELNFGVQWNYKGKKGTETLFHEAMSSFFASLRDWAPAFRLIAEDVLTPFVEQQFSSEGSAGGSVWAPLAKSTIAERGSAHPILKRSGALLGSFRGGDEHEQTITRQTLRWGSRVPYALFHQTGTGAGFRGKKSGTGGGRGMPARPILVLTNAMKRRMRSAMVARMTQIARMEGYRVFGSEAGDPAMARKLGTSLLGGS